MKIKLLLLGSLIVGLSLNSYAVEPVGQYEQDIYDVIKIQHQDLSEAEVQQVMGFAMMKDKKWDRAETYFKDAVKLDPKLYKSWYNLGLINIASLKAYEYFGQAIKANPDYSTPYYWIAYNKTREGKFKEALPLWRDYLGVAGKEIARGNKNEQERVEVATEVVKEIRSGKEGEELSSIHIH